MRIAVFCTICLAAMAVSQPGLPQDTSPRFVRGDVNGDYDYSVTDAVFLLEYLFLDGEEPLCLSAADVGDDGHVDLGDALRILFFLFLDTELGLPPPYPTCGIDLTPDALTCESYPACVTPPRKTSFQGFELIYVRPGDFLMGSPPTERSRSEDETLHQVTITCGFYLGKYEVTREQYGQVMGAFPVLPPELESQTGGLSVPNTPVFAVSWDEAVEFCRKLSLLEGIEYRLPTEAEWEYACRAGTSTRFSFGDALECIDSSCGGQPPGCSFWADYFWQWCYTLKKPVDGKLSNPWGFYGMHGNVGEWCQDWYGPYPIRPVIDPMGPTVGTHKVWRAQEGTGTGIAACRSAARWRLEPKGKGQNVGFRVLQKIPCSPRITP